MRFKAALVIGLCSLFALHASAMDNSTVSLPYEVEETLLGLLNNTDLDNLDTSNRSIVPIYRKDLDKNYIAYYEIDLNGKYFFVLSSGAKTGDYKEAQSGPPPLPSKALKRQAKKAGKECSKFYLLCSMGLYMCENARGRAVAATYNWTAASPVSDWKTLQKMVEESSANFTRAWKNVANSSKEDWKTSCQRNTKPNLSKYDAKVVSPGSTVKVALEENYGKITIHAIPASKQDKLCAILEDVCKDKSKDVNQKLIQKSKCGIQYLEFQVKNDTNKILKKKEMSFYFKIETKDKEQLLVYFSVDLGKDGSRRSGAPDNIREWSVDREDLFPDYNQHKCCGCWSGCVPVAWAMILGYYDRVAENQPASMIANFSKRCWNKKDGNNGVAPDQLNADVKKYVIKLRTVLKTYCTSGGGGTDLKDIARIDSFTKKRNIPAKIYKNLNQANRGDPFRDIAIKFVKGGFPAHLAILLSPTSGHAVVATRYRERRQEYRQCGRLTCSTRVWYEKEFYVHMGWGGNSNGWKKPEIYGLYAMLKKDSNLP